MRLLNTLTHSNQRQWHCWLVHKKEEGTVGWDGLLCPGHHGLEMQHRSAHGHHLIGNTQYPLTSHISQIHLHWRRVLNQTGTTSVTENKTCWVEYGLTTHLTLDRSFWRQCSRPITWLMQNTQPSQTVTWVILTKHNYYKEHFKFNLNNHRRKLLTYAETEANKTKAWFRGLTPSDEEMNWEYSTASGAHTRLQNLLRCSYLGRKQLMCYQ